MNFNIDKIQNTKGVYPLTKPVDGKYVGVRAVNNKLIYYVCSDDVIIAMENTCPIEDIISAGLLYDIIVLMQKGHGTMSNDQIKVRVNNGYIVAYEINDEDENYKGVRIEFVSDTDKGTTAGRPAVSLEMNKDGELESRIYDYNSEDPIDEHAYET